MLGIYAKSFMTATGLNERKVRPIEKKPRRWSPTGHWIDPPQEF
mgnify:CR=1 FL=1